MEVDHRAALRILGTVGLAAILWIFGARKFGWDREWIYDEAHGWAANTMFVFIGLVVINIGYHKWRGRNEARAVPRRRKPGAVAYWVIAALMLGGLLVFRLIPDVLPEQVLIHRTFWLEAWEIMLLATYWILQTWDRWNEGAPPGGVDLSRPGGPSVDVGD